MAPAPAPAQSATAAAPARRLWVINPNTSASVSALLHRHVQAAAGAQVQVRTLTARFGAPYIACEASYAVAAHAALDAWAAALAGVHRDGGDAPEALLVGCFGDPGLLALRDNSPVPVTGLAEASFITAARHGQFAIVTGGERWGPMLQRLAQALGHSSSLAGIRTVAPTGAQLAADPQGAVQLLAQACRDAVRATGAQAVILGGAGSAGMAAAVQPQVPVPVIDSVVAGAQWALHGAAAAAGRQEPGRAAWESVSAALAALGMPG
ncbi:MAG: Asp/Glu racemase [Comamonadaceae bacterium]|nr:MAG: Asp/Glu racemase [Comamonadaceae bacterium]